jgi:hypothetical protein
LDRYPRYAEALGDALVADLGPGDDEKLAVFRAGGRIFREADELSNPTIWLFQNGAL